MSRPKPRDFIAAMADQDTWADDGSCREEDARMFDTVMHNKQTLITDDVMVAMDVCADCPVMVRCLEHAIRYNIRDGVWGGMVYEDRLSWALRNNPGLIPQKVLATLRMDEVVAA
jgi:WhiB family transcriptional regulator, redox-sensing transcriptional regulator